MPDLALTDADWLGARPPKSKLDQLVDTACSSAACEIRSDGRPAAHLSGCSMTVSSPIPLPNLGNMPKMLNFFLISIKSEVVKWWRHTL